MTTRHNRRRFLRLGTTVGTGLTLSGMGLSGCASTQKRASRVGSAHPSIWKTIEEQKGIAKNDALDMLLGRALLHASDVPDYSAWIEHAEHHCRHEYNLLGSGWVQVHHGMKAAGFEGNNYSDTSVTFQQAFEELPDSYKTTCRAIFDAIRMLNPSYVPIDWQIDFKSGMRYSVATQHNKVKYGVTPGVDAKVPSALGRGFHLVTLALAYQHRRNDRYAVEIMSQILDWLAMNPTGRGAGWRGVMNVAIRVANWVTAANLIRAYLTENRHKPGVDFFLTQYIASLKAHGLFLMNNLELPETAIHPNHYIANIAGLLVVAGATRGIFKEAVGWERFAIREITHEIRTQVLDDGMDFECATAYQAFALEMFLYSALITANSNSEFKGDYLKYLKRTFGNHYVATIRKMSDLLAHVHKPTGRIPLAGDYDSGRFLKLEPPSIHSTDRRSAVFLCAALFRENRQVPPSHAAVAGLLLGNKRVGDRYKKAGPVLASKAFTASGFYVMRNQQDHCFISCGPIGTGGLGGHAHNDKLAFELTIAGKDIFIDPGVYVYTASLDLRNMARATRHHNTLMIAGQEQNRFATENKWWGCLEETRCRCLKWETTLQQDVFVGEHRGYEKLTPPIVHHRRITFGKQSRQIIIVDKLVTDGPPPADKPELEWNFMLHPDCKVTQPADGSIIITNGDVKLKFTSAHGQAVIGEGWFSPEYGVRLPSKRIRITSPFIPNNTLRMTW